MEARNVSDAQWKYWKHCLRAYLQGKKTMNWIVGVLDFSSIDQFDRMVQELSIYGRFPRHADIPKIRKRIVSARFSPESE